MTDIFIFLYIEMLCVIQRINNGGALTYYIRPQSKNK